MKLKTIYLILVSLFISISCGKSCAKFSSVPVRQVTLRLNWTLYGEHAPFFVAKSKGFFKEEGLDVEIIEGSGSATTVRIIGSGSNEFGYAGAETVIRAVDHGVPVKVVGVINQINPMAVIFLANKKISKIKDLIQKRVGITTGDANSQLFQALLSAAGVDPKSVTLVSLPTPRAKEDALIDEKVDAFLGFYTDQPLRMEYARKVDLDWLRYVDFGINTLSSSIVVNNKMIKEDPEMIRKFLRACQKGFKYVQENPTEATEIFSKIWNIVPPEIVEAQIKQASELHFTERSKGKPIGWSAPEDWTQTIELMRRYGNFSGAKTIDSYFTNEFLSDIK